MAATREHASEPLGSLLAVRGLTTPPDRPPPGRSGAPWLDGLDLAIAWGQTSAVVAEAGGGKTLLARVLIGLSPLSDGTIRLDGLEIQAAGRAERRRAWQRMQLVPAAAGESLDPMWPVIESVAEPLRLLGAGTGRGIRRQAREALLDCGIGPGRGDRLPAELTAGERVRVALARALAMHPDLVILDDPLRDLDLSAVSQLVERLRGVQLDQGVAFLLLTRDLSMACALAEHVAVMAAGRVVEEGPAPALLARPQHPVTRALVAASAPFERRKQAFSLAGGERPTRPVDVGCPLA